MKKRAIKWIALLAALVLMLPMSSCGGPKEAEITILSQNLRISADGGDNDVFLRVDRFAWLLNEYKPDVAGLQEYDTSWDALLYDYLEESNYGIVFQYRGDHEATPIIYNKDRVELLEHTFYWLSDTPEVASSSWDDDGGKRNRIVTECIFKEKESGIKFVHINTHFGLTAYCQEMSGAQIHDRVAEKYADMPVFVTGDFNTGEGSQAYENIVADNVLTNSYYLAEEFGNVQGTFNNFKEADQYTSVIDFVFVTDKVNPIYYSVLNDKPEGKFVSDHFGVLTKNIITK